jgi:hypothetical protein
MCSLVPVWLLLRASNSYAYANTYTDTHTHPDTYAN